MTNLSIMSATCRLRTPGFTLSGGTPMGGTCIAFVRDAAGHRYVLRQVADTSVDTTGIGPSRGLDVWEAVV